MSNLSCFHFPFPHLTNLRLSAARREAAFLQKVPTDSVPQTLQQKKNTALTTTAPPTNALPPSVSTDDFETRTREVSAFERMFPNRIDRRGLDKQIMHIFNISDSEEFAIHWPDYIFSFARTFQNFHKKMVGTKTNPGWAKKWARCHQTRNIETYVNKHNMRPFSAGDENNVRNANEPADSMLIPGLPGQYAFGEGSTSVTPCTIINSVTLSRAQLTNLSSTHLKKMSPMTKLLSGYEVRTADKGKRPKRRETVLAVEQTLTYGIPARKDSTLDKSQCTFDSCPASMLEQEQLLKIEMASFWVYVSQSPQIVLNTPEEAFFIFECLQAYPSTIRQFVTECISAYLKHNSYFTKMFMHFGPVMESTRKGYDGAINKLRHKWNSEFSREMQFRNVAHMLATLTEDRSLAPLIENLIELIFHDILVCGGTNHQVDNLSNAFKHLFRSLRWSYPHELHLYTKALAKFYAKAPNPCLAMSCAQWKQYWIDTPSFFLEDYGELVGETLKYTYNFQRIIALRSQEGFYLVDDFHVRIYCVVLQLAHALQKRIRGAHIWLTDAKNIDPTDFVPQFVHLRETREPLHNIVEHILKLRELKKKCAKKFKWKKITDKLLFHPITGEAWTYSSFQKFWTIAITRAKERNIIPRTGKYTQYTPRKTFSAICCEYNINIESISAVQRNSTTSTVAAYYTKQYRYKSGVWFCEQLDQNVARNPNSVESEGLFPACLRYL